MRHTPLSFVSAVAFRAKRAAGASAWLTSSPTDTIGDGHWKRPLLTLDDVAMTDTTWQPDYCPRLRPLEAFPLEGGDGRALGVRDPSGLSEVVLVLSPAALHVMSMLDGRRNCRQIHEEFLGDVGQALPGDAMQDLLGHLDRAHFLDGPSFEDYYTEKLDAYRAARVRRAPEPSALDILEGSGDLFDEMLATVAAEPPAGYVVGLVAPHLDYPRGAPCYAQAYAALKDRTPPERVIVLGTNHFGRSSTVVATACDFETPLGVTRAAVDFLTALEARCGFLRTFEYDHAREHSIELQVAWLQHLFGPDRFRIVPLLCPDPCGPQMPTRAEADVVGLTEFSRVLGELVAGDQSDTLIVAGADLSHIGAAFGDDRPLDDGYLAEAKCHDLGALDCLVRGDPNAWVQFIAAGENATHICSAGCTFALATALSGADTELLTYHQAVDQSTQTCVTSAALVYTRGENE